MFPFFNVFSMAGMILVEGFLWTPVVFLLMGTPFRSMDPSLEEAAVVSGSSEWQVFRRVTFPMAAPSVLSVLILTFGADSVLSHHARYVQVFHGDRKRL
jgi:iron(III) transport system permease protein